MKYFINPNVNEVGFGTYERPFKSFSSLPDNMKMGDEVLIKCGSVIYENIKAITVENNGTSQTLKYSSYGEGNKPIICGGRHNYNWVNRGNYWSTEISGGVGNNFDISANGVGVGSIGTLDKTIFIYQQYFNEEDFLLNNNCFYYDSNSSEIRLRVDFNPNNYDLVCSTHYTATTYGNTSFENLSFMFSVSHGIQCGSVSTSPSNININNCEFYAIGGGKIAVEWGVTQFGNGIEFFNKENVSDITVTNCIFNEIFDVAFTIQGDKDTNIRNINVSNNVMINCCQAIELTNVRNNRVFTIEESNFNDNFIIKKEKGFYDTNKAHRICVYLSYQGGFVGKFNCFNNVISGYDELIYIQYVSTTPFNIYNDKILNTNTCYSVIDNIKTSLVDYSNLYPLKNINIFNEIISGDNVLDYLNKSIGMLVTKLSQLNINRFNNSYGFVKEINPSWITSDKGDIKAEVIRNGDLLFFTTFRINNFTMETGGVAITFNKYVKPFLTTPLATFETGSGTSALLFALQPDGYITYPEAISNGNFIFAPFFTSCN